MKPNKITIPVSAEIGRVSGLFMKPKNMKCLVCLSHGAGADMHHAFMQDLAETLAGREIGTLRYNFPFKENKKGAPDRPPVAHKTVAAALQKAFSLAKGLPVFLGGKSFGGRMSSQYLAGHSLLPVAGIIFYGFPLHAAGKPSLERAEHLKQIKIPMLFLQGTRDALADFESMKEVTGNLKKATLVPIENADHSFKAGKINTIEILAENTDQWVGKILKKYKGNPITGRNI